MALEVLRGGHDDSRDRGNELRGRARVRQPPEPYRHIHGVPDEVLPPVPELKMDMKIRVSLYEGGEARYHVAYAKARRHAHPKEPAQLAALANAVLRVIERREDRLDPCQKFPARFRGRDGPSRAREEPHAELLLELGNDTRGLGLGQAALARGRGKAAQAGNP